MEFGRYYIVANTRDQFTNESNQSNHPYNDHPSLESINYVIQELRKCGFNAGFFGGVERLIEAYSKKQQFPNTLFLIFSDGLTQVSRKAQSAILLELLGCPYVGSDPLASLMAGNKAYAKRIVSEKLNVPEGQIMFNDTEFPQNITFPVIIKQWFVSKDRNRKTRVLFAVFLVLSMCLCIFADLPQNKLDSSIEHLYKLNMFAVTTYGGQHWDDVSPSSEGIAEVVLDYAGSVSDGNENLDPNIPSRPTPSYSLQQNTLPFNREAFRLADKIKYGTYFTKAEQVILSWEMAQALYPNDPEKMLGEYIEEEFYGLGKLQLEVVGIFDVFNETEVKYLNAIGVQMESGEDYNPLDYTNLYFINGKLTEQLEEDAGFYSGSNQRRDYEIYFDSYRAMKDYYDAHYDVLHTNTVIADYSTIDVSLVFTFEMLFKVSLPVAVFMVLFAILFYVSLIKTEFVYNNRFVSVFEYAGYSKSKVINRFILLNIWELIRIEALATVMALAVTWIVNVLNGKFLFVNFQIFSYNAVMIGAFLLFMILLAGISVNLLFRRVRVVSWYENLISNRDLI